jgi:hypothetical protein
MENKSDKYVTEFVESDEEYENESLEDQTIEDRELINIPIDDVETIMVEAKEQIISFNNCLVNLEDISSLKNEYLIRYNYDEIIGILLNTNEKLQLGASIIIDEIEFKKITDENFYNNYDIINEKTASIISILLKCMPIHVEKNNKMFNRFEDEPTAEYLYYIKKILLILKQNVKSINFNIIKKLFPKLFYNIYRDYINDEELLENQMMRKLLLKIN